VKKKRILIFFFLLIVFDSYSQFILPSIQNNIASNNIFSTENLNTGTALIRYANYDFQVIVCDGVNKKLAWDNGNGNTGNITLPTPLSPTGLNIGFDDPDLILTNNNGVLTIFVVKIGFIGYNSGVYLFSSIWNGTSFPAFSSGTLISNNISPVCNNPNIDDNGGNDFVVTWDQGSDIYVRVFQLKPLSPYFSMSPAYNISASLPVINYLSLNNYYSANKFYKPDIAVNSSGNIFVCFGYGIAISDYHTMIVYEANLSNPLNGSVLIRDDYSRSTMNSPYSCYYDSEPRICAPNDANFPNDFAVLFKPMTSKCWILDNRSLNMFINHKDTWYFCSDLQNVINSQKIIWSEFIDNNNFSIAASDDFYQIVWEYHDVNSLVNSTQSIHLVSKKIDFFGNSVSKNFSILSSIQNQDFLSPAVASKKKTPSNMFAFAFHNKSNLELNYKKVSDFSLVLMPAMITDENRNLMSKYLIEKYEAANTKFLGNKFESNSTTNYINNDAFSLNEVVVYPNPNKGLFKIIFKNTKDISFNSNAYLYNSSFDFVNSFVLKSSSQMINLTNLKEGIYFLKIISMNKIYQIKILITH
jgi:Secretion system C-terminal sorting domain